jgi:four helix bundle protein
MAVRHYQELTAWQKAMDLVTTVYASTDRFPSTEVSGLRNQIRRAAVSIPSNIAEGQGRRSVQDFIRYLAISRGSLQELETQVLIAARLTYLSDEQRDSVLDLCSEVGRLLNGLSKSLTREQES